jgi:ArsR family transcriptional regulator
MDTKAAARVLRAFGDPTRLRILALLARRPASVGELVQTLRRRQPAITRHLTYLHGRGFVEFEQMGPHVVYRLTRPADALPRQMLAKLLQCLETIGEVADDRARAKQARVRP